MSGELKTNTITVRLTDKQLRLLRDYVKTKGLNTEADGIRRMIDGASAWLQKTAATDPAALAERIRKLEEIVFKTSGESKATAASHQPTRAPTSSVADAPVETDEQPLGYIGGRLNVGLPGSNNYDDDSEASKFPSIGGD